MPWNIRWERDWRRIWQGDVFEKWERAFHPDSRSRTTPFGHPLVQKAWVDTTSADRYDPFLLVATHDDGREALHLFVRARGVHARAPSKELRSAGGDFFDYTEPVVLPGADGNTDLDDSFWSALKADLTPRKGAWFDVFEMPRVRAQSLGGVTAGASEVALSVRLDAYDSFDAYVAGRSKKLRAHFRRTAKRLADLGEVRLRVFDPTEVDEVLGWIPNLIREKEDKYAIAGSGGAFEAYLSRLAIAGMASGLVRCSTLTLDGRAVSWSIDFVHNKTFYAYVTGFDPEFAAFGVGHLHALRQVEAAFDEGIAVFDLLWGDERYKSRWTDGETTQLFPVRIVSARPLSVARRITNKGLRKLGILKRTGAM